ncbi:zinc finger CCHC domain-containing protein 10-like isoform X2 [Sceloporus undulatus]|uniref:zinc finger CCHC domain-containing protein 10-like isoform X2 n=1 Tax=Sceloporus undulatus TaxID=8520 RepID=UPI001C4ADE36|nr:zinc finger CCHC domain-containing protein 10-like isoform X2 [Sceloporus undulatus]
MPPKPPFEKASTSCSATRGQAGLPQRSWTDLAPGSRGQHSLDVPHDATPPQAAPLLSEAAATDLSQSISELTAKATLSSQTRDSVHDSPTARVHSLRAPLFTSSSSSSSSSTSSSSSLDEDIPGNSSGAASKHKSRKQKRKSKKKMQKRQTYRMSLKRRRGRKEKQRILDFQMLPTS